MNILATNISRFYTLGRTQRLDELFVFNLIYIDSVKLRK